MSARVEGVSARTERKKKSEAHASLILRRWIARNVRSRRHRLRLTVQAASKIAGVHWRHWQKVESGTCNVTLETIARIAQGLSVDLQALLCEPVEAASSLRKEGGDLR